MLRKMGKRLAAVCSTDSGTTTSSGEGGRARSTRGRVDQEVDQRRTGGELEVMLGEVGGESEGEDEEDEELDD